MKPGWHPMPDGSGYTFAKFLCWLRGHALCLDWMIGSPHPWRIRCTRCGAKDPYSTTYSNTFRP